VRYIICNKLFVTSIYLFLSSILLSCGGGGGSSQGNISAQNLSLNTTTNRSIDTDQSQYFAIEVVEGATYAGNLNSLTGDSDFAISTDSSFSDESVIVYSIEDSLFSKSETVFFTAESTQTYYVEVYGFDAGNFTLVINETSLESAGLTILENEINFLGVSNQKVTDSKNINIVLSDDFDDLQVQQLSSTSDWLQNVIVRNGSLNHAELDIINSGLPSDVYYGEIRITNKDQLSTKNIYKDIQVNYTLLGSDISNTAAHNEQTTITISNPDVSRPLRYEDAYGPENISVTNNQITFTPDMPLLGHNVKVNWGVNIIQGSGSYLFESNQPVVNESGGNAVVRTGISMPIGSRGIQIKDFDNDNKSELLVTDLRNLVYTLEFDGTNYVQDWVLADDLTTSSESFIQSLVTHDMNGDGYDEFLVGVRETYSTGVSFIYVIDGKTRNISQKKTVDGSYISSMRIADLDNNGSYELVFLSTPDWGSNWTVSVYDLLSFNKLWMSEPELYRENNSYNSSSRFSKAISIGNIDTDAAQEIVTQSGAVYDGASLTKESKFGDNSYLEGALNIADYDGDNRDEIALVPYVFPYTTLKIYDPDTDAFVETTLNTKTADIRSIDIDNDSKSEIMVAGQTGGIMVYEYADGLINHEHTLNNDGQMQQTAIAFGDTDNDNQLEVVWAGFYTIVVSDYAAINNVEWQSYTQPSYRGPFTGGYLSQDNNGSKLVFSVLAEAKVVSTSSFPRFTDGPMLLNINPVNGDVSYSSLIGDSRETMLISIVDYDKDGFNETLCVIGENNTWSFGLYDPQSNLFDWKSSLDMGRLRVVGHGDVNNDGFDDVVTWGSNDKIVVYDAISDTIIWESSVLANNLGAFPEIIIQDLDDDNKPEIIALFIQEATGTDRLFVFKQNTNDSGFYQNAVLDMRGYTFDVDVQKSDVNNTYDIAVLAYDFNFVSSGTVSETFIKKFDSQLQLKSELIIPNFGPNAFYVNNQPGQVKYLLSGRLSENPMTKSVIGVDVSGNVLWSQTNLLGASSSISYNYRDTLNMVDVNSDNIQEIIYTTNTAVYYSN